MSPEVKEMVDLMKEWKDEVKGITIDYKEATAKLDEARKEFKRHRWLERLFDALAAPMILLGVTFVLAYLFLTLVDADSLKIGNIEITKRSPAVTTTSTR
jgi:hypothetical protein